MRKGLAYLGDLAGGVLLGAVAHYGFGLPQALMLLVPLAFLAARTGRWIFRNWRETVHPALEAAVAAFAARWMRWKEAFRSRGGRAASLTKRVSRVARRLRPAVPFVLECAVLAATGYLAGRLYPDLGLLWSGPWSRARTAVLAWAAAGMALAAIARRRSARRCPDGAGMEAVRLALLGGAGLWLMRGFARFALHGTPDALWYATMLKDITAQSRAGVFPFWVGQSLDQFNGSIYPLRVAPYFHYAGAVLDFLTLRSLGTFALQNLLVTLTGIAGLYSAYFCVAALLPNRRWQATALAILFLSCPGVLGVAYNTDLFMSWMTLPWLPVVWFATVRSFNDGGAPRSLALLGVSLGLCWWGHSPIALWTTLLAAAAQVVRLFAGRSDHRSRRWGGLLAGVGFFAAIAAYPVGSVLLFPPEPGVRPASFQIAYASSVAHFIREAFPGMLLPVSARGRDLADFQLGYALWFVLVFLLIYFKRIRSSAAGLPVAAAGFLALLTLPIPGVSIGLWTLIPGFVRNTTGNWAMNRLYLAMAAPLVVGSAAALAAGFPGTARRNLLFSLGLAVGCLWSLKEAAKFAKGSQAHPPLPATAVDLLRDENILVTRFAYLVFPSPPGSFTEGAADPYLENRLLRRNDFGPLLDNAEAARASGKEEASADFVPEPAIGPGVLILDRKFTLEPSGRYLLQFDGLDPRSAHGVLQIKGPTFFREYELPEFGGERSFGAGGRHSRLLSVWTSASRPEELTVHFYPDPAPANPPGEVRFAHVRLLRYPPLALPVVVKSWIPCRIDVRSPAAAWLETPRMYQTGYRAAIAGVPAQVRKSPDGLVAVAVPSGNSQVELAFHAPLGLQALFYLSIAALLAAAIGGLSIIAGRPAGAHPGFRP